MFHILWATTIALTLENVSVKEGSLSTHSKKMVILDTNFIKNSTQPYL